MVFKAFACVILFVMLAVGNRFAGCTRGFCTDDTVRYHFRGCTKDTMLSLHLKAVQVIHLDIVFRL